MIEPCCHAYKIYNFKNNIIIMIIQFDFFVAVILPMKKKFDVYFSTGNKGVDDGRYFAPDFALTIKGS